MIAYPNKLDIIFDKMQKCGVIPIIIGGYIRDYLLEINSKDIDIEVYNIPSYEKLETLLKEFGSVNSVGKSFGVCKLQYYELELDFTLPRVESKISQGHKGFEIEVKENIDFYNATKRRDFTINSIGYDVVNKKLLDPFHGIDDLKSKTLRATSTNTFTDDPLRALRAVQFCARFNLNPDEELESMIINMMDKNLLNEISKERIFLEFQKLLLQSSQPSIGFKLIKALDIIEHFLELKSIDKKGLYAELLSTLDAMAKVKTGKDTTDLILMFAAISFFIEDLKKVESFLNRFTNDKNFIQLVINLVTNKEVQTDTLDRYTLSKLASTIELNLLFIFLGVIHRNSSQNLALLKDAKKLAKKLHILDKKIPSMLRGEDLINCGLTPSKEFKIILEMAYDAQLKGKFKTHEEALVWIKRELIL